MTGPGCALKLFEQPLFREAAGSTLRPGGTRLTERALDLCAFQTGSRILDVGCGPGATLALLRERGFKAFGLDRSEALLAEARQSCPVSEGFPAAQADGSLLPIRPDVLGGLLCECVLSLLPDRPAALREFRRVLAPGGLLVLTDVCVRSAPEATFAADGDARNRIVSPLRRLPSVPPLGDGENRQSQAGRPAQPSPSSAPLPERGVQGRPSRVQAPGEESPPDGGDGEKPSRQGGGAGEGESPPPTAGVQRGARPLRPPEAAPQAPPRATSCLDGATDRRTLERDLAEAGLRLLLWEDHHRLLAELAARLVFARPDPPAGGRTDGLSAALGTGGACDGRRFGYFLAIAAKA